jgi:hypothetical protein
VTRRICEHETAVVQAVLGGQWPDACDEALRSHAAACEVCREVVAIVPLLREEFVEAREAIGRRDVPLPSAGQIWWRAAVHARADAARAAARPLVWGYGAAAACAVGVLVASIGLMWPSVLPVFDGLAAIRSRLTPVAFTTADMVMATLRAELPIVIAVAACLVAAPIALYYALREE